MVIVFQKRKKKKNINNSASHLPFEVKVPNAETVKTMQETENGENIEHCKNTEDMFNKLGI